MNMSQTAGEPLISVEDYLTGELSSEVRHEFVNGEVLAMVGASMDHNTIAGNLFATLHGLLQGGPCRPFIGDVKVRIQQHGDDRFYYPDLVVSCSPDQPSNYYTDSPVLIVEVLSDSTERHDRAEKFHAYRKLESLQEYVLVAQDLMRVEVYRRASGWELELFGAEDRLRLESVELELAVAQIYARTELAAGGPH